MESLPAGRLLLLVNYRPEYEHRWGSKTYYTQLRLDPLQPGSAEELLDALLGEEASLQPVKGLLIEHTEGNPLFLEESVRTLVETKVLAGERGAYRLAKAVPTIQVPATVQAVLAARIDRLPPEEKRLLQAASVIGKDVSVTLLQAIADQPEDTVRRALSHLQAAEFLYEARLFPELEYAFKHVLTHEVAYGSLLHERRRALHRQAGEALEHLFPDRAEEWYTLLAHHFIQSGDPAKGLQYSRRAADRAERLFAHDEALRSLDQARACAEALNRSDELAAVYEAIGDVHFQRGLFQQATLDAYHRASGLATSREQRARLKLRLGRSHPLGDPRRGDFLQAALEELDPATQPLELAEATAMLGRYHHDQGQHAKAIAILERARELAEPLDDAETLMLVYAFLGGAHRELAQMAESTAWARRCIELGERKGYLPAVALGYEFLAEGLALLGQWQESLACSTRNYQTGERIGQQHRMAWAEHDRARALYGQGDLSAAAAAARAGLPLADATGDRRLAVLMRAILSRSEADLGMDDVALVTAQTGVARSEDVQSPVVRGHSRHALAYVHVQREEWDAAADLARQCTELLAGTDSCVLPLVSGPDFAEVAWRRGQWDEARRLIEGNLALARSAGCRHYEAVARRVQGQICAAAQSFEEAAAAFNHAIEILEELGSRLELGRALYGRGILQRAQGHAASGREDLARARARFAEIGARRDLERVAMLLAEPRHG